MIKRIFKFGLNKLDQNTGGLKSGSLVIAIGSSGAGKTAFCRTICESNFEEYKEAYIFEDFWKTATFLNRNFGKEHIATECDVLIMGETANFYSDAELDLYSTIDPNHNYTSRYEILASHLKNRAVDKNEAIILTITTNRDQHQYSSLDFEPHYYLRTADCVIHFNKTKKQYCIIKNRYGNGNKDIVDFDYNRNDNDKAVIKEI